MPTIAPGSLLPRSPLAEVAIEQSERDHFIWNQLFPVKPVPLRASERLAWDASKALDAPENLERGVDGKFPRRTKDHLKDLAYSCKVYGLGDAIDLFEAMEIEQDFDIDSEAEAALAVWRILMRAAEIRCSALAVNTSIWPNAVGPKFVQDPTAGAEAFVATIHEDIFDQCGESPTTMAMGFSTYLRIGGNDEVKDRVKLTTSVDAPFVSLANGQVVVAPAALAQFFQIERVLVSKARVNSKPKGSAASISRIWNEDRLWVGVTDPTSTSLKSKIQATCTFAWDKATGPDGEPFINPPYADGNVLDVIEAWHALDHQAVNTLAGKVYTGINAAP